MASMDFTSHRQYLPCRRGGGEIPWWLGPGMNDVDLVDAMDGMDPVHGVHIVHEVHRVHPPALVRPQ